jgi:chaperone required for assembly of F1-ATPase
MPCYSITSSARAISVAGIETPRALAVLRLTTVVTLTVIFILALLTVAGEIYSDTLLRSGEISHAAPDPVTIAVAHGIKH